MGYRAVDGALVVVYGDDELVVPLPGWSFEEVGSIVDSIRLGDWSRFHQVMSWGTSQVPWHRGPIAPENLGLQGGEIAYGSDSDFGSFGPLGGGFAAEGGGVPGQGDFQEDARGESEDSGILSALGAVVEQVGVVSWVLFCWVFVLGLWHLLVLVQGVGLGGLVARRGWDEFCRVSGDCYGDYQVDEGEHGLPLALGVCAIWSLAVSCRVRSVLVGYFECPPRLLLEVPGCRSFARVDLDGSIGWIVWIVMVICFGLCHPAEASPASDPSAVSDFEGDDGQCRALAVRSSGQEPERVAQVEGFDVRWGVIGALTVISIWEALKFVCRGRRRCETAESQTEGTSYVPLPLEGGVPNRARILECLWQAGYAIDIDHYPSDVQDEYFSILGERMRRRCLEDDDSD